MRSSLVFLALGAAAALFANSLGCDSASPPPDDTGGDTSEGEGGSADPCEGADVPPDPVVATWSSPLSAELLAASGDALFTAAPLTSSPGCHVARLDAAHAEIWSLDLVSSSLTCTALAADGAGNLFLAGSFDGEIVDLGLSPAYDDADLLSEALGSDASLSTGDSFLAKIDPQGALQWIVPFGGPGMDSNTKLAVSPEGLAAVTGTFSPGGVSFGADRIGGPADAPLAVFSSEGALLWTAVLPAPSALLTLTPRSLALGAAGEVYLSAAEAGLATIDVARFDEGELTWASSIVNAGATPDSAAFPFGPSLSFSDDHLFLSGELRSPQGAATTVDLGTGPLTATAYLARWTSAGAPVWSQPLLATDLVTSLSPTGDLHLAARAFSTVTLGVPSKPIDAPKGLYFAAVLSPTGQLLASTTPLSNNPRLTLSSLASLSTGDDVLSGYTSAYCPLDFGQGPLGASTFLIGLHP